MQSNVSALWTRLSILEARIQQESGRPKADPVRLELLERMKTAVRTDIEAIEHRGAGINDLRTDAA